MIIIINSLRLSGDVPASADTDNTITAYAIIRTVYHAYYIIMLIFILYRSVFRSGAIRSYSFAVNISAKYSFGVLLFFLRRYNSNTRILYSTCYNYTICIIAVIYLYYRYYLYNPICTVYIFTAPYPVSVFPIHCSSTMYCVYILILYRVKSLVYYYCNGLLYLLLYLLLCLLFAFWYITYRAYGSTPHPRYILWLFMRHTLYIVACQFPIRSFWKIHTGFRLILYNMLCICSPAYTICCGLV